MPGALDRHGSGYPLVSAHIHGRQPKMALIRFRTLNFVEDLQRQGGTLRAA
jgi:hypothetical protein